MDSHSQPPCCRVSLAEICSLYQKLFQIPVEMNLIQAAVDQVCGSSVRSSGFCCSAKLLDVLVEVERRRWVKEQIYWDFQLLDFNRDCSLSLSDVKILLQKAQESQVTCMSWVDFLTQRQDSSNRVTWSELETWLFETAPPNGHKPLAAQLRTSVVQDRLHENDQLQYQGELMDESKRLKNQFDAEGLEVLVRAAENTVNGTSHFCLSQEDLAQAVEHKYAALSERLFCDMLQTHYGAQVWVSLSTEEKEQNLNEFKMLAEFGLERGSELVLSQLPGAAHNFRNEESRWSSKEVPEMWTGIQGLKELRRRLELERGILNNNNTERSSSVSNTYQYLQLFVQIIKVKMESSFRAALLVVEPYWNQSFWDGNPVSLESCFEELAHIRLTIGHSIKPRLEKKLNSLRKMAVAEDKLLSLLRRQEETRDLLFQLLQSCSHDELQEPSTSLLQKKSEEPMDTIKEVPATNVVRNPLRQLFILAMTVTKTCLKESHEAVTWGECAVRLLVQVQLKQELELRELILELAEGFDKHVLSGQQTKAPDLNGQDSVSDLIRLLQPLTPNENLSLRQFKSELVSSPGGTNLQREQNMQELDMKKTSESDADNGKPVKTRKCLQRNDCKNEAITAEENKGNMRKEIENQEMLNNEDFQGTRPEECADREVPQEQIDSNYTSQDSSSQAAYKKRHIEKTIVSDLPADQSESSCGNMHDEQISPDELTLSVMEATENLIAGLMTLKAKVEQAYLRRGSDGCSPQRITGSNTETVSLTGMKKTDFHCAETQTYDTEHGPLTETLVESVEKGLLSKVTDCDISSNRYIEPYIHKNDVENGIPSEMYQEMNSVEVCIEGKQIQGKNYWETNQDPTIPPKIIKNQNDPTEFILDSSTVEEKDDLSVSTEQADASCDNRKNRKNIHSEEIMSNILVSSVQCNTQSSSEHLASTVMEAAERLIVSLMSLKEEIARVTKSPLTEKENDCRDHDVVTGKTVPTEKENEDRPASPSERNKRNSEDTGKYDRSLEDETVHSSGDKDGSKDLSLASGPLTREIPWELHPECSQGYSHAKIWESNNNRGQFSGESFQSETEKTEERTEGLSSDLKKCDELHETLLKGTIAEKEQGDWERKDQQVSTISKENKDSDEHSHTTQKEGSTSISTMLMDDSSEDGCSEQGSAAELTLSFLEAAHNLIGGLIPNKEDASLSTVRQVVVILTDSASVNEDSLLNKGEQSELSETIGTFQRSSDGESQVPSVLEEHEARDDHSYVPVSIQKGHLCTSLNDCVQDDNIVNPEGRTPDLGSSTKLTEADRQPSRVDCQRTEKMCHTEGCEMAVESQCRDAKETEKENIINKSTTDELEVTEEPSKDKWDRTEREMKDHIKHAVQKCKITNKREYLAKDDEKMKTGHQGKKGEVPDTGIITTVITTRDKEDPVAQPGDEKNNELRTKSNTEDPLKKQNNVESEGTATDVQLSRGKATGEEEVECNENEVSGTDNLARKDKADDTEGRKKEEQCDQCPSQSSPDTVVKNFLIATQDLVGSLTSVKDRVGMEAKTKTLVFVNDINQLAEDATSDQNSVNNSECPTQHLTEQQEDYQCGDKKDQQVVENDEQTFQTVTHEECLQSCTSLCQNSVNNSECPTQYPTEQQEDYQCDDKKDQHVVENEKQKLEATEQEQSIFGMKNMTAIEKKAGDEGLQGNTAQTDLGSRYYSMSEPGKENMSELHLMCTEMGAKEIVPDDQGHRSLNNKWRSVSENKIKAISMSDSFKVESHLSERITIQITEKSKSLSCCYNKKSHLPPTIATVTAESELGEDISQTCSRNGTMKNEQCTTRIKEKQEEDTTIKGNNEFELQEATGICKDNHEPCSLNDLPVSLLEATDSLIGRLASLKGKLRRSLPPDSVSTHKEVEQNEKVIMEHKHDVHITESTPLSQINVLELNGTTDNINNSKKVTLMSMKGPNGNQLCIRNESRSKAEMMIDGRTKEKTPMGDTIIDEKCENVDTQEECETEEKQSKEISYKNESACSLTGNVVIIQPNTLNQGEDCNMQKDTDTKACIADCTEKANSTDPIKVQFMEEPSILQEQIHSTKQTTFVERQSQTCSQAHGLHNGRDENQNNAEEHNTVYHSHVEDLCLGQSASQLVSSEYELYEMYNVKFVPEKSEIFGNKKNKEEIQIGNEVDRKMHDLVEKIKVKHTESTEMKELEELQSLKSYIRKGVIKSKRTEKEREYEEEKEEKNHSKNNDKESDQHFIETESQDTLSGHGEVTHTGNGEGVELENRNMDHNQVAGSNDGLVEQTESLLNVDAAKPRRHKGDVFLNDRIRTGMSLIDLETHINKVKPDNIHGEKELDLQTEKEQPMDLCSVPEDISSGVWSQSNKTVSLNLQPCTGDRSIPHFCSLPSGQSVLQREKVFIRLSVREQEEAMQRLTDLQREAELKCASDRRRQTLRFQERLAIAINRKSELDLMDIVQRGSPLLSPEPLQEGGAERQKSAVREHVENMKRERTNLMQTRRDRNMNSFRDLLDPVHTRNMKEDSGSELRGAEGM